MLLPPFFVSCDWGSSTFRLRLIRYKDLEIVAEVNTDKGILAMNELFQRNSSQSRVEYFVDYLSEQIENFPIVQRNSPIVISGMASSSIGMIELPYSSLPIDMDGKGLCFAFIENERKLKILLISGIKCEGDVMRGEETQVIGLSEYFNSMDSDVLILPGTHSKHIFFKNGILEYFSSFITGEMFSILSTKSILSKSIQPTIWSEEYDEVYKRGVVLGHKGEVTKHLFSIRANDLLQSVTKEENYHFLSGLLVGDELRYLSASNQRIVLAASEPLLSRYRIAMHHCLAIDQLYIADETILSKAVIIGHEKVLRKAYS